MPAAPGRVLIPAPRIAARIRDLGAELTEAYAGRDPVLVAIMKGCVLFLADLVRAWPATMDIEFVTARSYRGREAGPVEITMPAELAEVVPGRSVLIVDDILDTGRTLAEVCRAVAALGPEEVRTLVLLAKQRPDEVGERFEADWVGFEIEDRFVVGYGLDFRGRFRNLPHIATLAD